MICVETLVAEANEKGLWLNNLFQLRSYPAHENIPAKLTGMWQANFHTATGYYEFGQGDSAVSAIQDALRKAEKDEKKFHSILRTPQEVADLRAKAAASVTANAVDPFS